MIKPLINVTGRLRVLGYTSGSGNTLWKALELQRELEGTFEGCPYEIVGIFSDNPNSKSVEKAEELGIPYVSINIKGFYNDRNKSLNDKEVRKEYDLAALELFSKFKPDIIILAGYVWAISSVITDKFVLLNCHPGDLTLEVNGSRILAGANGIKSAFSHGLDEVRSSSHLVTSKVDGGPVLFVAPPIPVDYTLHDDEEARFRYYLGLVNEQNRLIGARTILELALGSFGVDEFDNVYYKNMPIPNGVKLENWNQYKPSILIDSSKMFKPRSIAVIGASNKEGIGKAVVRNIINAGFPSSNVYAVNVRAESVEGAKGYASVLDIPDEVDMAVIAVASRFVLQVVQECGEKGITAINCVAAGFKEIGEEGKQLENELLKIVNKYSMRMIGPNCMGIVNNSNDVNMNATIISTIPRKGNIAMVTQSGALGAAFSDFADEFNIGFSIMVSAGNQADMNVCDCLSIIEQDENTKVVMLYLETINDPQRFRSIVSKMKTPVVVLKSGRTEVGASAASSHTGSMVGNDDLVGALLSQCGAIRAKSLEDAFLLTMTLSKIEMPKGNRVGIVTNTGGLGILTADALLDNGLLLPKLPVDVSLELKSKLFPEASAQNPIDVIAAATPEHYRLSIESMVATGLYDILIITCVPPATVDTEKIGQMVVDNIENINLLIMTCFFGPNIGSGAKKVLKKGSVPTFDYPEKMADILGYLMIGKPLNEYVESHISYEIKDEVGSIIKHNKGKYISPEETQIILEKYEIPMAKSDYIKSIEDIEDLGINYPLVAKIDHPDIIHKSDVGGVRLNIKSSEELIKLFEEWTIKFEGLRGIFVQEFIVGTHELIVGSILDPILGHGILVGSGGTLVEVLHDTSFAHVPIASGYASKMINKLKMSKVLKGYRGEESIDTGTVEMVLMQLNQLLVNHPEIEELDINPLTYDKNRGQFIGLDARIKIKE